MRKIFGSASKDCQMCLQPKVPLQDPADRDGKQSFEMEREIAYSGKKSRTDPAPIQVLSGSLNRPRGTKSWTPRVILYTLCRSPYTFLLHHMRSI